MKGHLFYHPLLKELQDKRIKTKSMNSRILLVWLYKKSITFRIDHPKKMIRRSNKYKKREQNFKKEKKN